MKRGASQVSEDESARKRAATYENLQEVAHGLGSRASHRIVARLRHDFRRWEEDIQALEVLSLQQV